MQFVRYAEEEHDSTGSAESGSKVDETALQAREVWERFLEIIRTKVSEFKLNTYFKPIKPLSFRDNTLLVAVPSQAFFEMVISRFGEKILAAAAAVLGPEGRLFYEVDPTTVARGSGGIDDATFSDQIAESAGSAVIREFSPRTINQRTPSGTASGGTQACRLDPSYTFENFVRGKSNELAVAAAISIANSPAKQYNPLMIFGGVGLGKTHLIQAIANCLLSQRKVNLMYISSEQFTSNFVHSIQTKTVHEFERFYKSLDVLIVDDIQFFQGKESTQDSFFQIFNSLYHLNKQIVLSCDKPPAELDGLEKRLSSRFQWGLTVDIMPPDLETRIAILSKKCEVENILVDYDILEFVALSVKDNIRSLEGCLKSMAFDAFNSRCAVNMEMAKRAVRKYGKPSQAKQDFDIGDIIAITAKRFGVDQTLLRMKTKRQEVVTARHVAMFFAKEFTGFSLQTIGSHFGGRNHASVIHACKCIEKAISRDKEFAEKIQTLREDLLTT